MSYIESHDCVDVLRTIQDGRRLGPWSFGNLSILEFENCIYALEKNELIIHNQDDDSYEITTKGVLYLTDYYRVIQVLASKSRKKEQILS